ncbi:MAG: pyridoxamine 5'-phosphate oxidase [Candidatus Competibacteraceae bacterium]|nr:pyridoxamine 5'-phosphate oxidase [Candidatus Competibacteraceae bacterium]
MKDFLSKLRKDYSLMGLSQQDVSPNPFIQFERWMAEAANSGINEPNAMTLATVDEHQRPHSRIVLLRNFDQQGLVFYTNYESEKSLHIQHNPHVSLTFFWVELERQVRIDGLAGKISILESTEYFQSRPIESQISAWASPQSRVISSRQVIEDQVKTFENKFKNQTVIEKPPHWGGFRVVPTLFEFWQGRPSRLHDRIRYRLTSPNDWMIERLAP